MSSSLLEVRDLAVGFPREGELAPVVEDVSLGIEAGQTLAIVGESGCGKTVTGLALMGLTPPPGKVMGGSVRLDGRELLTLSETEWEKVRGREIGMIFQDPLTSLDPVYNAGEQIAEGLRFHFGMSRAEAWREAVARLEEVGIPEPAARARSFPHQLSGGMRQRVMIAAAIACRPRVLIADEPTTALDVTVQAQILDLLERLQSERGMAMIIITHDLGVVARVADRVAVMYAGQVVEQGTAQRVMEAPAHPYTAGLIAAVPRIHGTSDRLATIPGTVPAAGAYPPGCRFRPRCPRAGAGCEQPQALRVLSADARSEPGNAHHEDATRTRRGSAAVSPAAGTRAADSSEERAVRCLYPLLETASGESDSVSATIQKKPTPEVRENV